ncbi:CelD/BcsL family acetyltransferase involved in cellulose biosynthesis [Sphingobium fontiphilum]|uniref:CelD/BcsL family acetyltransferase involved in cellulose biosynthesis n=1 Tax=Sphingobium fontiphilum TaxID=944425 RepID=A0A7W6GRS8_9SPHN|nr:GNAT family N-acetyltransferase [Sphingobium fontiphilum]MBB3983404.1 CelD/BcsL family acetyltransferase involved in cellulose biosynthesis [Sphingobium fontiphilum]
MTLKARFCPLPEIAALGARWRALEARGRGSFFLGWTWTGAWLATYGVRPELLAVTDGDEDVGLALVGHAMQPRLLGRAATLLLGQSGDASADRPFIEYNGLLTAVDRAVPATTAAMAAIDRRRDWRVLKLAGVEPDSALLHLPARRRTLLEASPAYMVDLAAVRAAGGDYLTLLGGNTRSQIRRAMKDRGGALPIASTPADDEEAGAWIAQMHALNGGRHQDNAWDDAAFRRFVEALVRGGRETGEVELLRFADAGGLVGLLVNFRYRGRAMNYQSAFVQPTGAKDKPGLLCHAAAVARYADAGMAHYSLLAGKDRYKESLSTCQESLEWWALERFAPRLEAEALLRRMLKRPASA